MAMQQIDQQLRGRNPGEQSIGQLVAHLLLAPRSEIAGFRNAVLAQKASEGVAREPAGRVLERRVRSDDLGNALVGQRQPQLARVAVDRRRADQARQGPLLHAEHLGLFCREAAAAQAAGNRRHLLLVGLAVFVDGNLGVAEARQGAPAVVAEDVGHAPQSKGDDQEAEQDLGQPVHRAASHCIEHGSFRVAASRPAQGLGVAGQGRSWRFFRILTRTRGIL